MSLFRIAGIAPLLVFLLAAGCGGDNNGSAGGNGAPSVSANAVAVAPGPECPAGGVEVETGIDENLNGLLDDEEVDESAVLCSGEAGADGLSLAVLVDNQVGDACNAAGVRVRVGQDDNGNGTLDAPAEVDDTAIACGAGTTGLRLAQIGRYESGIFDESAAEIVAHDPDSQQLFVVNANDAALDVLDIADPTTPVLAATISAGDNWVDAGGINSVAVADGLVAAAVENDDGTANGRVQFYDAGSLAFLGQVEVGNLPDLVTFAGADTALVANEGEPCSDYSCDPEGSVSVIDASDPSNPTAMTASFADFNAGGPRAAEVPPELRLFGNFGRTALTVTDTDPATLTVNDASGLAANDFFTLASSEGDPILYRVASVNGNVITLTDEFDGDSEVGDPATVLTAYLHDGQSSVAQDLEPEYIAVSPDGNKAWVTLQENNAVAQIDIATASVDALIALGFKDHSIPGNELDAGNNDDRVNIRSWPLMGMYMPDAIASFEVGGQTYYVTANEGDAREYDALVEEVKVEDVGIDPDIFADAAFLEDDVNVGDINTSIAQIGDVDTDGDGLLDDIRVFGARSFSIWAADGTRVFDSGSDFAVETANRYGLDFNNDNAESDGDGRSDNKGSEPEAVTVAEFNGRQYAFIGLERIGGIMVYDVTNPASPTFVHYDNNRNFAIDIEDEIDDGGLAAGAAGDLGPESIVFIPAADSPLGDGVPLLAVGNEVSGTTTIYRVIGN
ncbi:choice-of-anchor I family protein [Spectribacter hydrogenoxidans]|uniref:Choice-of-anchor I family protein n=1 Tax=Spectribacter hydrogenoxidans TaxID=3075608 RepID=A0ABU3BZR5_9GAMM|nr:choice-of-anchor I family protein [Salinisphaera sp. W335]MDT0634799.1 choice-of-anchor I family protein [Salinisphaera sp. W335]